MLTQNLILFKNFAQSKKYRVSQKNFAVSVLGGNSFYVTITFSSFICDTLIVKIEGKFSLMATKTKTTIAFFLDAKKTMFTFLDAKKNYVYLMFVLFI